jgi:hypothetical protein
VAIFSDNLEVAKHRWMGPSAFINRGKQDDFFRVSFQIVPKQPLIKVVI